MKYWLLFGQCFHLKLVDVCRGHTVKAVCESFQMSKDAGFKVVSHMMPDLPNVGWERDIEQFVVSIYHLKLLALLSCEYTYLLEIENHSWKKNNNYVDNLISSKIVTFCFDSYYGRSIWCL